AVGNGHPRRAGVRGFENSTSGRAEIVDLRLRRHARHGEHAAAAERADLPPSDVAHRSVVARSRGRSSASTTALCWRTLNREKEQEQYEHEAFHNTKDYQIEAIRIVSRRAIPFHFADGPGPSGFAGRIPRLPSCRIPVAARFCARYRQPIRTGK